MSTSLDVPAIPASRAPRPGAPIPASEPPSSASKMQSRRARIVGAIGNGVEWYDWTIYGLMTPFIASQFFPDTSPLAALLSMFVVFAIGFAARPLGGYLMVRFADRTGRRAAMVVSVTCMCAASLGIAVCPPTESIGLAAAGILVFCRLIQGLSLGSEQPAALSYLVETAPRGRVGNFLSFYNSSALIGILCGSGLGLILIDIFGKQGMSDFGWRIPFFVGALLALLAFAVRRHAPERTVPEEMRCERPLRTMLSDYRPLCVLVAISAACSGTLFFATVTAMPAIATQLGTGGHASDAGTVMLAALIGQSFMIPVFLIAGWVADRVGPRKVFAVALVVSAVSAAFVFAAMANDVIGFVPAQILMSIACALFLSGVLHTLIPELPIGLRFSALAVFWLIPACVFGGLAPIVMAQLAGHGLYAVFGIIISVLMMLAIAALAWYGKRTR